MIQILVFKKYAIAILLGCLFISGVLFFSHKYLKIVNISGKNFIAELALTPEDQEKGLGKKKSLCHNCAMLFDFSKKDIYIFWMKDMNFDLDIIWIADNRIVYIEKNVSHKSLEKINPHINSDKVIEINAGLSKEFGFKVGDNVTLY